MHSVLQDIINSKTLEISQLLDIHKSLPYSSSTLDIHKSLSQALKKPGSIIAEIKRRSPAHGTLSDISNPVKLAHDYIAGGASAISVLTDKPYFNGSMEDLHCVSKSIAHTACPVLRKDFIIDPVQLFHSIAMGADAVLLIVAVLQNRTQSMIDKAESLGLEVLLEVHTREELAVALDTSATIIGVNNRNLHTLNVDIQTSLDIIKHIPTHIISVSESGIRDAQTAARLFDAGYSALLVGEALVKSDHPGNLIQTMRGGRHD